MTQIRLDRIFREVKDLVPASDMDLLTPSVVHGVVPQSSLGMRPQQAHRDGYSVAPAKPNDFVISLSSHAHGIEWCGLQGGISPDYTLLRPIIDTRYARYLKYALKSQFMISQLGVFKTGIRMGLRLQWNKVRYCKVDLPQLDDAIELADHLDRETARIDTLIAKKTRFIKLLHEKRRVLITHAVTKGLDANAPMKDSGVEWLGSIPAHWAVVSLKRAVTFQRGHDLPESCRNLGDVPIVSSAGVSGYHDTASARGPGIVTGRYGSIGQFTYMEEDYWPLNTALFSRSLHKNSPRFIFYMLHSISDFFVMESIKSAVPGIDRNDIHEIRVALPSRQEQDTIASHLEAATSRIDALIAKTERSIDLLREHRTALITAAVTGKIDLRDAA